MTRAKTGYAASISAIELVECALRESDVQQEPVFRVSPTAEARSAGVTAVGGIAGPVPRGSVSTGCAAWVTARGANAALMAATAAAVHVIQTNYAGQTGLVSRTPRALVAGHSNVDLGRVVNRADFAVRVPHARCFKRVILSRLAAVPTSVPVSCFRQPS